MRYLPKVLAASALLLSIPAGASGFSVEVLGPSYHSVRQTEGGRVFNNATFGLGVGYTPSRDVVATVGAYRNSFKKVSWFAEIDYTPLHLGRFDLGGGVGVATGYQYYDGGGALKPIAGLIGRYNFTPSTAFELRAMPLHNAPTFAASTHFGVLLNAALRFSF